MINKKYKIILLIIYLFLFSCKKEEPKQENKGLEYKVDFVIKSDSFSNVLNQNYKISKSIFDIMIDLKNQNKIDFKYTGEGDKVFITEINQIQNEGSGKQKKNWLYFVNGELAQKGVSQLIIEKDAEILWCFTTWEEKEKCTDNKIGGDNEHNKEHKN